MSSGLVGSSPGFGLFSENVFLTGKITATSGKIGEFNIGETASGTNLGVLFSDSNELVITGSTGQITGSKVLFDGGKIGGFEIVSDGLNSINNSFQVTGSTGQMTASNAKIEGNITATSGEIGGLTIRANNINSDGNQFQITGSTGQITGSNVLFDGGRIGGFDFSSDGINSINNVFQITGSTGELSASNARIEGSITATSGDIAGWTISGNDIIKTTGTNLKTIQLDSNTPMILVQSGSGGTANFNEIRMDANAGNISVRQDGAEILNTGKRIQPLQEQKYFVKSAPVASANEFSTDVGDLVPITELTHLSASRQIGTKNLIVDDIFRMKSRFANIANKTPFYVSMNDPLAQTNTVANTATPILFEVSKSYDTMDPAHEIGQSAVFSTLLNSNDDGGRFVASSNTTGSAIYHFQTILTEASANHFDDAKLAHIRSDVDVHDLAATQQKQFVHFDARTSSGSAHNQRVFQVHYDGEVVSANNITAFAGSSAFLNVSDKRLKKDIYELTGSINKVLQLRPTEFTWKEDDKQDVGFIAQEVEEVIPEVVQTTKGFMKTDENDKESEDIKTIAYSKLVPYLVDTIQVLTKRIEHLEKKVK